ncbi:MAG: hypothetical protein OEL20_04750 [Sulfuritalea sp.]|nr:hypothetical protein [Sulfuritalea sp.]
MLVHAPWRRELLAYAPSLAVCTLVGALVASQMIRPEGIRIMAVWLLYIALYRMVFRKEPVRIATLYVGTFLTILCNDFTIGWLQHLDLIADPIPSHFVACNVGGQGWTDGLVLMPLLAVTFGLAWNNRHRWPRPVAATKPPDSP